MSETNPRKNSYGYTIRVETGVAMSQFSDIRLFCSASSNGGFNKYLSASTLFVGASTVYSSTEGLTFTSGQWVYAQTITADAFTTADDYELWVEALATGKLFISPVSIITVDA